MDGSVICQIFLLLLLTCTRIYYRHAPKNNRHEPKYGCHSPDITAMHWSITVIQQNITVMHYNMKQKLTTLHQNEYFKFWQLEVLKDSADELPLAPMGVLAPRSANASSSARPSK